MVQKDYDTIKKRWLEYWYKENHDRPIMCVCAPLNINATPDFSFPDKIGDRWLDVEFATKYARFKIENTYYAGEGSRYVFQTSGRIYWAPSAAVKLNSVNPQAGLFTMWKIGIHIPK